MELLAPNGKPSNLTPEQYKLVRTPEFKAWFGDWEKYPKKSSKVVDENGEPLVVYHGTPYSKFAIFKGDDFEEKKEWKYKKTFWFTTDKKLAEAHATKQGGKGNIYKAFLNIKKPKLTESNLYKNEMFDGYIDYKSIWNSKKQEFDKLPIIHNAVTTESNQIKLADGTNTTFDNNNPDIRYAGGGNVEFTWHYEIGGISWGSEKYESGGEIPDRYKSMGFNKVGEKKKSTRPEKKWMVLAKKGDEYKVVNGGYKGMEDYTQHKDKERRERFWDRMGGKNSNKAKDPFSPLYWHKKFGTWEKGGEIKKDGVLEDNTIKVVWTNKETPDTMESKMFDNISDAKEYGEKKKNFLIMELEEQGNDHYKWQLLPYGDYKSYKTAMSIRSIFE